jgi:uncharacterized SAM-binding protein YcdF (DUF218 family)
MNSIDGVTLTIAHPVRRIMTREHEVEEEDDDSAPERRRHPLTRLLLTIALLYAASFLVWIAFLPTPKASDDAVADAIVALTGDGDRLTPAVALLEMGNGDRLLISGVNKQTSKGALKQLLKGGPSFDCCADLGFAAADTRGNAEEAAVWAHRHHYKSLIVVTAAYHMPRSLMEFSAQMPDVTLIPYPVLADPAPEFSWQTLKRLNSEYAKYIAAWVRLTLFAPTATA